MVFPPRICNFTVERICNRIMRCDNTQKIAWAKVAYDYHIHSLITERKKMTPEEIVAEINRRNRVILYARQDYESLTHEQVLALMDNAGMQGFQYGSNVALSMVQGALSVQLARVTAPDENQQSEHRRST